MRVLKQVFDFYINSSIHVALAVVAMTWVTLIQFELPYNKVILYFVFFATITGYNFVKYFGVAKFHHRSLANWLKAIQIFSFFAFIGMCFYVFKLHLNSLMCLLFLGIVTFLYAMPLLPMRYFRDSEMNLRQISGLKIYVIALVWASVTVLLPLIEHKVSMTYEVVITTIQRFVFVLVLMLPFEIRDLKYDSLKLATIPQQIGIKKTKIIGFLLLLVFVTLEFFMGGLKGNVMVSSIIISIMMLLFLWFSKENQSKYYSAFWVETIPIFWVLLLLF